jgi:glycine/D-amino acid oxidase-like deaminating enzyme
MRVAVLGNGVLGLAIAYRLAAERGVDVTIVGPEERPGGASPAAGAMLNSMAEVTVGCFKSDLAMQYFGMSYLATQMWPDFEQQIIAAAGSLLPHECSSCQVSTGGCFGMGTYVINNTRASEMEDRSFLAIRAALEEFNVQFADVDPGTIPNYDPDMLHRAQRALFIHGEGWVNPKIFLDKLDRLLRGSKNVRYENAQVCEVEANGGGLARVKLDNGNVVEADHYVLAAGVGSRSILKNTAFEALIQPLYASVGISIEVRLPNSMQHTHVIRTPNRGGACGIYTVPYFKGPGSSANHVLIGASNVVVRDPRTHGRIVSMSHLMHAAIKEINQKFHNAEFVCANVGNRPSALDQYPLLGKIGGTNISMATGTKRDGFHLAPLISKLIADSVVDGIASEDLQTFRPDRPLIRDIQRQDAIDMIVSSKIDEAVQHGFVPSSIFQLQQIKDDWARRSAELHDKFGAHEWGIPSQLFNIYATAIDNPEVSEDEVAWLKKA